MRGEGRGRTVAPVLGVLALAGCGSTTIIKTVTQQASSPASSSSSTASSSSGSPSSNAKIGDALTLQGANDEMMQVTVLRVLDPPPSGQFDQPSHGNRFVGVEVRLANVGQTAYDDSPSNGATLLSASGGQAQGASISEGPCGSGFASSAKIAPGEAQEGCIPFEMPQGTTPAKFQFTLNSGFANQTGEWDLSGSAGGGASAPTAATPSSTSGTRPCDPNISASSATSCPFAENVFKIFASALHANGAPPTAISATSPTTGASYAMNCSTTTGGTVTCTGGTGALVTFPLHAAAIY